MMRYNLYIKIHNKPELIPFDIFDTSKEDSSPIPCSRILHEILTFLKLQSDSDLSLEHKYKMYRSDIEIDLHNSLSENGIRNGDIITLSEREHHERPQINDVRSINNNLPNSQINHEEKDLERRQNEKKTIPGKKIDFD